MTDSMEIMVKVLQILKKIQQNLENLKVAIEAEEMVEEIHSDDSSDTEGSMVDEVHESRQDMVLAFSIPRTEVNSMVTSIGTLHRQTEVSANTSYVHHLDIIHLRIVGYVEGYAVKRFYCSDYELNEYKLSCTPSVCVNDSKSWTYVFVDAKFAKPPWKPPDLNLIRALRNEAFMSYHLKFEWSHEFANAMEISGYLDFPVYVLHLGILELEAEKMLIAAEQEWKVKSNTYVVEKLGEIAEKGFYEFWNWLDLESCYPRGRIICGVSYPGIRSQISQALVLLINRKVTSIQETLELFMDPQTLADRKVRKLAFNHEIHSIRKMNQKHKNASQNGPLQNMLYTMLQQEDEMESKRALATLCELHRRKGWFDGRYANAICMACFRSSSRIMVAAMSFLIDYEINQDEEDNSYVMKCIIRVLGVADISRDVAGVSIQKLTSILAFEKALFPILQKILADGVEFFPCGFQLLAQLVEFNNSPLPQIYTQIYGIFLSPDLWKNPAYAPALARLLRALLQKAPQELIQQGKLAQVLDTFKNLSTPKTDDQGFYLLNTIIEYLIFEDFSAHTTSIWSILFSRLQSNRAAKFVKSLVVFMSLFIGKHGTANLVNSMNVVHDNIFSGILQQFWILTLRLIVGAIEVKVAAVAAVKLLCESLALLHPNDAQLWGKLLDSVVTLISLPVEERLDEESEVPDFGETMGNSSAYIRLHNAGKKEADPVLGISDSEEFLVTSLSQLSALPSNCLHMCVDILGAYKAQTTELSIILTTIGLLWTATDFIGQGLHTVCTKQELAINGYLDKVDSKVWYNDEWRGWEMSRFDALGLIMLACGITKFLKAVKGGKDAGVVNKLIGQFGVEFYSAFLVAGRALDFPFELDLFQNEALAGIQEVLAWKAVTFLLFSLPRPPKIDDLEDNVVFKG